MSLEWIEKELGTLQQAGLMRELKKVIPAEENYLLLNGKRHLDFSGNDYLGLRRHPKLIEASCSATQRFGTGSGASRLISGNLSLYDELESEIARFKHYSAGLVFNSGYCLNASVIPAVVGPDDAVILDRLNHASLIDGAKLSGARMLVYPHCDMNALEKALYSAGRFKRRLLVTDTVFSMDGDIAPLKQIATLAEKHDAELFVDEAHATGVLGPQGRGVVEALGLSGSIPLIMGTFSKALGSFGAYLVCGSGIRDYLINKARGLIYTTALPPAVLAASLAALQVAEIADDRRSKLLNNAAFLRKSLAAMGLNTGQSESPIIPIIIGDEKETKQLSELLLKKGLYIPAVRYPTVKKKQARLRVSLSACHSRENIEELIKALQGAGK